MASSSGPEPDERNSFSQLPQNHLEPELVGLVHDDEEELVRDEVAVVSIDAALRGSAGGRGQLVSVVGDVVGRGRRVVVGHGVSWEGPVSSRRGLSRRCLPVVASAPGRPRPHPGGCLVP